MNNLVVLVSLSFFGLCICCLVSIVGCINLLFIVRLQMVIFFLLVMLIILVVIGLVFVMVVDMLLFVFKFVGSLFLSMVSIFIMCNGVSSVVGVLNFVFQLLSLLLFEFIVEELEVVSDNMFKLVVWRKVSLLFLGSLVDSMMMGSLVSSYYSGEGLGLMVRIDEYDMEEDIIVVINN